MASLDERSGCKKKVQPFRLSSPGVLPNIRESPHPKSVLWSKLFLVDWSGFSDSPFVWTGSEQRRKFDLGDSIETAKEMDYFGLCRWIDSEIGLSLAVSLIHGQRRIYLHLWAKTWKTIHNPFHWVNTVRVQLFRVRQQYFRPVCFKYGLTSATWDVCPKENRIKYQKGVSEDEIRWRTIVQHLESIVWQKHK